MQAIITTYHGPTDTKGSRISAKCERGTITIGYPHDLDVEGAHIAAAAALVAKFVAEDGKRYGEQHPWTKPRATGQIPSGAFVHVFIA